MLWAATNATRIEPKLIDNSPVELKLLNRSAKRKLWTPEQMEAAMKAVSEDGLAANHAARVHGVPPSTLKDRFSGRVLHGRKPGPALYLSQVEEQELVDHFIESFQLGCGKTKRQVKCIVEKMARVGHYEVVLCQ